jgi:predicted Fe-Mo cluster-binding NifX family protein
MMALGIRAASALNSATAILVLNSHRGPMLCPFFQKCDGVLLIDSTGKSTTFHERDRSGAQPLCNLIVKLKPRALICSFIGQPERRALRAAGIDVRLGFCSSSIAELLAGFERLPPA